MKEITNISDKIMLVYYSKEGDWRIVKFAANPENDKYIDINSADMFKIFQELRKRFKPHFLPW